ncbi:MAG: PAS domain S-box protein [Desulfobaccales bacterium]|nr:PAS domain S-box protein [Methylotenera sp.]MDP3183015.1 PAS domain S-box protein [Desulfobaccales bacterium]
MAKEKVTLQLKWHHQFQFAGYYAAKELGYYSELGLDVELLPVSNGQNPVENVLKGGAEYGVGTSDLVLLRAHGNPVVALGTIFQHSPYILLALQKDGIQSIADLKGRRVMIDPYAAEIVAYLKYLGLYPNKIKSLSSNDYYPSDLVDGKVDAYAGYITNDPYYLEQRHIPYLAFTPQSEGIDFYGDTLFTLQKEIDEHPERASAFLKASLKGWTYAIDHPEATVDLMIDRGYVQASERMKLLFEAKRTQKLVASNLVSIGYMNPARWQYIADIYADLGMVPKKISLEGFLYSDEKSKDSRWLWILGSLAFLGVIAALFLTHLFFGAVRDIAERKLMEEELRKSKAKLQSLLKNLPDLVWMKNTEGLFQACNTRVEEFFGHSESCIIGKSDYDFVAKDIAESFRKNDQLALSRDGVIVNEEWVTFVSDGHQELLETTKVRMLDDNGKTIGVLGIGHDITNRKQMEQDLKESEFRWKFAIEGAGDGVWDWDIQNDVTTYSKRWKEMFGYFEGDLIPTNEELVNLIHPEDRAYVAEAMQTYLSGHTQNYVVRFRLKCTVDNYKWILGRGMVVSRNEDGMPLRMIGTHTDITEHKQVEGELRIAAIAFESQEGLFVTDANSIIIRTNQTFTAITGYQAEEAIGQTPRLLASGHQDSIFYADMWQAIHSNGYWAGEIWNRRKNGEICPEYLTITAVKDTNGVVSNYVAAFIDISESKQREQQRLADEVALHKTLVREVHHRIKNNLQGVTSLLNHFSNKVPELATPINEAISQMQSIAVIHGLQGISTLMSVRLCELVRNVAANSQSLWKTSIIVDSILPIESCTVEEQEAVNIALVLNELISNAIKHGDATKGVNITFEYSLYPLQVEVLIANTGYLSNDDALKKSPSLHTLSGTGLELVSSLLGASGSTVSWEQCGDIVITKLELHPPVITLNNEQSS